MASTEVAGAKALLSSTEVAGAKARVFALPVGRIKDISSGAFWLCFRELDSLCAFPPLSQSMTTESHL